MMWGDFGWHSGWMGLWGLLFWGLVIGAIVFALQGRCCGGHRHDRAADRTPGKTALDILKERYARGEIDQAEFEQKRRDLQD